MAATRLRITGGTARGLPIAEPRGVRLRPTSGLVREALFNILGDRVEGAQVLDLYAGTGAVGLDALSRGASHATFVEGEAACCQAIHQSAARLGRPEAVTVLRGRVPAALAGLTGEFDIVFADPPYREEPIDEIAEQVSRLLAEDGWFVLEHGSRYNPPERPAGLRLADRRVYGDSALAFYTRQEGE